MPGRAAEPQASPPRSRPSRVPLPHPRGRGKQAALHPEPQARKRLTRLRTSHFVPSTSAEAPRRLLSRPWPLGAAEALPATPGSPAGPRSRAPTPPPAPVSPSVPSLHQPRAGAEPPPPLPPPHAGGRCIERPGLCQVVAPPPLSGLHTKRLRGSRRRRRRRRRPPRSGAGAGGAEEEQIGRASCRERVSSPV